MNNLSHPAMIEASRLTNAGRLMEATALLQRMLNGGGTADAPSTTADAPDARPWRASDVISIVPETGEAADPKPSPKSSARAGSAFKANVGGSFAARAQTAGQGAMPEALRGFLDELNQGGGLPNPLHQGSLLEQLQQGGLPNLDGLLKQAPGHTPVIVPDGAQFLERSFSNQAGSRAYKLYVPSGYHGQPLPLVVMLHGCTQSPDDFAVGTKMNALAEEHACFVAYPAQAQSANHGKCWNWFKPGDQQREQGEPSLIAGITRQIMGEYAIDPERVYVAGLSAGGAAAAVMGATYPDLYAAIGVHSGLACGAAHDMPSAFAAMRQGGAGNVRRSGKVQGGERAVPTIVFHGDQDGTVSPVNGDQVIAQAKAAVADGLRVKTEHGRAPGGHAYSRTLHADPSGQALLEQWVVHGAGHAWFGGSPAGSYTDPQGPDASREMMRSFLDHSRPTTAG